MHRQRHPASQSVVDRIQEEHDWVARAREGDSHAFEMLFMRYHASLVQFAEHIVGSDVVADEVVVDIFVSLWNRRRDWYVSKSSVADYLYVAVKNRALNVVRTDRRRQGIEETFIASPAIPGMGTPTVDILERLYAEDVSRALERAVAALPERTRTAITLRWQQQMSVEQIASILGVTTGAVQMSVSRGLKVLKTLLQEYPR